MRHNSLVPVFVQYIPEQLQEGTLYVSEEYQVAIHLCCCGCGEQTVTPLGSPQGWDYTRQGDVVTLSPSIGNYSMPCRSHYFIEGNQVRWV